MRERQLTLRAPARPVEVLPLPTRGQPASFGGAVGHFDVHATLAPSSGTEFEPMTLKLQISGRGNFDRVSTAGLPSAGQWKSYPPSASLAAGGAKIFEQAVVPLRSGGGVLPSVSFSFFDPDRRQYVTRSTAPIAVQVAPAPAGSATAPDVATASISQDSGAPAHQLRPNRLDEGRDVATLLPLYQRRWFWPSLAIPWLALALLLARTRSPGRVASGRARRRALRDAVARERVAMRRAAVDQDPVRFFEAAQTALQKRLGERWGIAPEEVTAAEADSRMGEAAHRLSPPCARPSTSATRAGDRIPTALLRLRRSNRAAARPTGGPAMTRTRGSTPRRRSGAAIPLLALIVAVGASGIARADAGSATFEAANRAFAQGRYADAAAGYETLERTHGWSAPLLYDLGNAYAREGQVGRAS